MSVALGLLVMVVFGAVVSLLWSMLSAALQIPVAAPSNVPLLISVVSAFVGSASASRRSGRWWQGVLTGCAAIFLYWGGWLFVSSRFIIQEVASAGLFGPGNLSSWILLLAIGTFGGLYGVRFSLRPPRIGAEQPSSIPLVFGVGILSLLLCFGLTNLEHHVSPNTWTLAEAGNPPSAVAAYFRTIRSQKSSDVAKAKRMQAISNWDGTQFDLFVFDLRSGFRAGIYDHDQHDKKPGDDRNYSYYGMNAARTLGAIQNIAGPRASVAVVFNGSPFNSGCSQGLCASHQSSVVYKGKAAYKISRPIWTMGFSNDDCTNFALRFARSKADLPNGQDYALCGVQPLSHDSHTSGGSGTPADLKTSRTSMAWDGGRKLYVLIVRDPDSEADSRRQAASCAGETGGWNVAQLRQFWQRMGVAHAVNLSGGDSSQLVYRWQRPSAPFGLRRSGYAFIPSSDLGMTIAYMGNRPVRLSIPTFPPNLMARGSLNYIYLWR